MLKPVTTEETLPGQNENMNETFILPDNQQVLKPQFSTKPSPAILEVSHTMPAVDSKKEISGSMEVNQAKAA